jgi:hypothetical protein
MNMNDMYLKNKKFYDDILQKYVVIKKKSWRINPDDLNFVFMQNSKHFSDYHLTMISLSNAFDLEIDGAKPINVTICNNGKSIDCFLYRDNCETLDQLIGNVSFSIVLTFNNTRSVHDYYHENENNGMFPISNFEKYIDMCDGNKANPVVAHIHLRYIENCDEIPLQFKFNYFVGG